MQYVYLFFLQCPHEFSCPKLKFMPKRNTCDFDVRYRNFPFDWLRPGDNDQIFNINFSYVVARKGIHTSIKVQFTKNALKKSFFTYLKGMKTKLL